MGPVTLTRVHVLPSHSHVSPSGVQNEPRSLPPPNSTTLPFSAAMAWPYRGLGPWTLRWFQVPLHSQVSSTSIPLWMVSEPPKSTTVPPSGAIPNHPRMSGPDELCCVQLAPSHDQVLPLGSPPKLIAVSAYVAIAPYLTPNHLGVLERGEKVPTLETVEAVGRALGVPVAELLADGSAGDAWLDDLKTVGAAVPPTLRSLALDVLGAFAKRTRGGRRPAGAR
jgi:hypothetical protein